MSGKRRLLAAGWTFGLVAACSSPVRQGVREVTEPDAPTVEVATATVARPSYLERAGVAWASRDRRDELARAIEIWERAAADAPADPVPRIELAHAYGFLGQTLGATGSELEEQELAAYEKGAKHAERALALLDPSFAVDGGSFGALAEEAAPAAYWWAVNRLRLVSKKGLSALLDSKDRLREALERVLALRPEYDHGGPDRGLGALFALLPTIAGKDLGRSEAHFEASIARAPGFLATRVEKAELLAVEREDRKMFTELLTGVLEAPEDSGDAAPENRAAREAAKKLLAAIDEKL